MNQKQYIGKKIRDLREEKGWTAAEFGEMLNPPKKEGTVTSWERGRTLPDADTLIDICIVFGTEISEFYYKSPEYLSNIEHHAINLDSIDTKREEIQKTSFLEGFEKLNDEGKQKVIEYIDDLICSGKYHNDRRE